MKTERPIKPTDSAIRAYYAKLEAYGRQGMLHEGAVSSAFENLPRECARRRGWTLIPQLEAPGDGQNVGDGAARDAIGIKWRNIRGAASGPTRIAPTIPSTSYDWSNRWCG